MKILAFKPGHDGAVAYIENGSLIFSLEAEKDSRPRFSELGPQAVLAALELAPGLPDVIAVGGWHDNVPGLYSNVRAGYDGLESGRFSQSRILGADVRLFTSSHERSHLFMTAGMFPGAPIEDCAILVWEGGLGAFYRWRKFGGEIERHQVMSDPGAKYAAVFALADPTFPADRQEYPRLADAGKLMALAAYGRDLECQPEDKMLIDRILGEKSIYPFWKIRYRDSSFIDCGLDSPRFWAAANYVSEEIFDTFRDAADLFFKDCDLPLLISGGCGLNCGWNELWRRSERFSEVFVPPCTNDSGSAIGTAIDAMVHIGSPCRIDWSPFAGPEFCHDEKPRADRWNERALDYPYLSDLLARGQVVAWVQGRCEIGPRALGHRSLLANPCDPNMRARLNAMKNRESYRPIAPCCRRGTSRDVV